jgi:hypothetical protein
MKLFKQLLVAPAALGLLAPVAATAAEINLDGVNKYASEEQVTSISQFSDVKPTDWAYQALSNLIERYGCVAGYPDGTYKGAKAMTRFEAAALLNACLDRVTEVTDELKKLMAEFEKELAILKGRVDGLEAKVGELEANQFSTTTKLKGIATFVIGGASDPIPGIVQDPVTGDLAVQGGGQQVTFNYDVRLILDTSFTGKDLLRTTLRSGNFGSSAFGAGPTALEVAFDEGLDQDVVSINRLFYQFPIGKSITATVGAKVRQDDMLGMWPSVYPSDSILDMFTYAGAPGAYNLNLGGGFGLTWKDQGVNVSINYVSNEATVNDSEQGIGTADTVTAQVGYTGSNWGAAFVYTYSNSNGQAIVAPGSTALINFGSALLPYESNNIGFSGYWQPSESSWMPSISAGFGYGKTNLGDGPFGPTGLDEADLWSWMVGLQWTDVIVKGNAFGIGLGMPQWAEEDGAESNFAMEFWYKFQVTDNISVTPAFFFIDGQGAGIQGNSTTTVGGLLKTTFKF